MIQRVKAHWLLVVILIFNVGLSLAFSLVNPLYESTDELHNYRYTRYILATGQLPELDPNLPRIQAHHPPLYFLIGAAATFWIPAYTPWDYEPVWNPFFGFHDWEVGVDNKNHYLHGPDEVFPTTGTPLAARVARWVNVVLGAAMVTVTYQTARRVRPNRRALASGAAALVAFNPQFLYLSGAINNDVAAGLAGSVMILACVEQVNRPLSVRRAAWMGLLLGVALNVKFNLVFTLIVIEFAWAISAWRERSLKKWLIANAILLAVTFALSGWWFIRNQMLYGEPTAVQRTNELWGARDPMQSWGAAIMELPYAWSSLWGRFGYGQIPMSEWIYATILIVTVAAALGLALKISNLHAKRPRKASKSEGQLAELAVLGVTVVIFAGMVFGYMLVTPAGKMGRFFFPALPALATLLMLGLGQFVSRRVTTQSVIASGAKQSPASVVEIASSQRPVRPFAAGARWARTLLAMTEATTRSEQLSGRCQIILAALVSAAMLALAVYSLIGVLAPAYARPASLTPQQIALIPHRLDVTFEGKARLLGYAIDAEAVQPGGEVAVTLYWQALAPMTENYVVFVHLVNPAGALSAQRNTFPGLGNLPTSQWKPGDAFADTYRVDIGETTYAPDETIVQVGLSLLDGPRLSAYGADGKLLGDAVSLDPVKILARPGAYPNATRVNFGNQLALLGYDLNARIAQPGQTISVTLTWQALAPMSVDYIVFMHLTGGDGTIIVKNDSFPYTSPKRTRRWTPGQVMTEVRALVIPDYAQAGLYDINMGVFSETLGDRLPIIAPDGHYVSEEMLLLQVRVERK